MNMLILSSVYLSWPLHILREPPLGPHLYQLPPPVLPSSACKHQLSCHRLKLHDHQHLKRKSNESMRKKRERERRRKGGTVLYMYMIVFYLCLSLVAVACERGLGSSSPSLSVSLTSVYHHHGTWARHELEREKSARQYKKIECTHILY